MTYLRHVFYVYSEASVAVFMAVAGGFEFLCGFLEPGLQDLFSAAGATFLVVALCIALSIVRAERKGA